MTLTKIYPANPTLGLPSGAFFAPVAARIRMILPALALALGLVSGARAQTNWTLLSYAPSQPGNPLKGLMPTCGSVSSLAGFPHSLQYASFSVSNVMISPSITAANVLGAGTNYFNWSTNSGLEHWIADATNDGCQLIVRPTSTFRGCQRAFPTT